LLPALVVASLVLFGAGCVAQPAARTPGTNAASSSAAPPAVVWPAPPDPMALTIEAGLQPEPKEYLVNHVHAHLDVFIDGRRVVVPAGIGINIDDPGVRKFNEPDGSFAYGGIKLCNQPCISPLHTHDQSGIIHTESATPEPNTLGEFFVEWGVELSATCVADSCSPATPVAFYVDGEPYAGDPAAIELTDRKVIVIVIGTPPAEIPSTADFSKA
jgi:hypothetical protein